MAAFGSSAQDAHRACQRQVLVPIVALVALVMATLIGLLWLGAERQDRIARERSIEIVDRIIQDTLERMTRDVKDYAWWNDSVHALVLDLDPDWADRNVGAYIYDAFGFDLSFVLDGGGRTRYASISGQRTEADAFAYLRRGLDHLIARTTEQSAPWDPVPAAGLLSSNGQIVVAGVSLILPEREGEVDVPPGASGILIFAERLDPAFWEEFASRYGLAEFHIVAPGEPDAMLPLEAADGTLLGALAWRPHRPGAAYFRSMLLPVLAGTIGVALATVVLLRRATRTLQESEARFRDVADASSDWIWETDGAGRLRFLSERFSAVSGVDAADVLGRPLHDVLSVIAGGADEPVSLADSLRSAQPFRNLLTRQGSTSGGERIVRLAGKPMLAGAGTLRGFRGTATDVTREVEAESQVRYLALHDHLTGLPNRTGLCERLRHAIALARRRGEMVAVLCLDLDRFKDVNDLLGHTAGDLLIRRCADRLKDCVRESDTVARLGGDEFAVVQIGAGGIADVEALCRRIISHLAQPVDLDGSEVVVTASIGVALLPHDGEEPGRLLQHADIALYRCKEEGRNTYRFFEPEMNARLQARKALEQDLRRALSRGELDVHYQPQISISDGRLTGVEALLRWHDPARGEVPPTVFVPVAEESGLILQLGEWVLRRACAQAVQWPDLLMSVNLSPVQFRHRDLVGVVRHVLADTGLPPGRLELEITEGVLLYDTETALRVLRALRELGVRIAMDDFGTGYSSLNYLQQFPFDKLKIDRSFVSAVQQGGDADAIIRAVVGLGHSLRLRTCAEGVETEEQLAFLAREGCDEVQGYYFSEAQPAEVISERFFPATSHRKALARAAETAR